MKKIMIGLLLLLLSGCATTTSGVSVIMDKELTQTECQVQPSPDGPIRICQTNTRTMKVTAEKLTVEESPFQMMVQQAPEDSMTVY